MARRQAYDIDAPWVDPCEARREERRRALRFAAQLKLDIAVDTPEAGGRLVGPGVVRDLSEGGVQVITKHRLAPSQRVTVSIPADRALQGPVPRRSFIGSARVVRVKERDNRCSDVALRFCDDFTDDMEFTLFVEHLRQVSEFRQRSAV